MTTMRSEAVATIFSSAAINANPSILRGKTCGELRAWAAAKMAKADGIVTTAEVDAFKDIFKYSDNQAANVARLYNLARQDVAGYEAYAEKMKALCVSCEKNCPILEDIVDVRVDVDRPRATGLDNQPQVGLEEALPGSLPISNQPTQLLGGGALGALPSLQQVPRQDAGLDAASQFAFVGGGEQFGV